MSLNKKAPQIQRIKRNFDASAMSRLTTTWDASLAAGVPIDQLLQRDLVIMRARCRDQARNNDYAKRFISMVKNNVAGVDGYLFQAATIGRGNELDKPANDALERAYKKAGEKGNYDVTGELTRVEGERLWIETVAKDGEAIIRYHTNFPHNEFRFAVEHISNDALDIDYNRPLANGNIIRMGVEFDAYRRAVNYHFLDADTRDQHYRYAGKQYRIIPASEIRHSFVHEEMNQSRGIPWMASGINSLQMLSKYREAALAAARVGAAKMGFYTTPDGLINGDEEDEEGNYIFDAEPGLFEVLPEGVQLSEWSPKYPEGEFAEVTKQSLRGAASGFGVSYNGLANDLEGVNLSSIRAGVLDEREVWKGHQRFQIDGQCMPHYTAWLREQLLRGTIRINDKPLKLYREKKYLNVRFQGRRWTWIDPLKDIKANVEAVNNRMRSVSDIIREQGRVPEDVWREIARDEAMMESLGITIEQVLAAVSNVDATNEDDPGAKKK